MYGGQDFSFEVGINKPTHPDLTVEIRMEEVAVSDCPFGCKIYADPLSQYRVLAHNSAYGCTKRC